MAQVLLGAALLGAAAAVYVYYERRSIGVQTYSVGITGLPEAFKGFTILHISDLHAKHFGRGQERLLKVIEAYDFDMLALTGDLIDQHQPDVAAAVDLVKGLAGKAAFVVTGNHERWVKTDLLDKLAAEGVVHLQNQAIKIERGGGDIWVVGVEAPHAAGHIGAALLPIDDPAPKVLLAHSPNIFESAVQHDIDLVLVGHTHGGQVRIPGLPTLYAPGQGLLPKYDYGRFSKGRTTMVVNGGLGESILSIRVGVKPEIAFVKLVPA